MYPNLPPSRPALDHAARFGERVALACKARLLLPLEPAAYVLFVPHGLDPAEHAAFWAAVAKEMEGTGWTLTIDGDHAFPEPA
jgi:hypothetical protein